MFCSKYCRIYSCQIFFFFFFFLGDILVCSGNPTRINRIKPCATSVQQDITETWDSYWQTSLLKAMTLMPVPVFAEVKDWNMLTSPCTTEDHYVSISAGLWACLWMPWITYHVRISQLLIKCDWKLLGHY